MPDIKINGTSITILLSILTAFSSAGYMIGKADREDVITNLENTIKGYEKVKNLDLQSTLNNISKMSDKLVLNIEERQKLNNLDRDLKLCNKTLSTETTKFQNLLNDQSNSIKTLNVQNKNIQEKYNALLPLIKEKSNIGKDVKYTTHSTIELIKDEFYIGFESVSNSYVWLNINAQSERLELGETKYYKHSTLSCYIRLKKINYTKDEAIFDHGCNI